MRAHLGLLAMLAAGCAAPTGEAPNQRRDEGFRITVVDSQTGRGVPLVELRTVHGARWFTDSAGVVAFDEPGLLGREVFFFVTSPGYAFPADGFGMEGVRLATRPGGAARLEIERRNLAERLYRITGAGIYADSVVLGDPVPIREPLLNGQVAGQDSALAVEYGGEILWIWGDTSRPSYPLGNFKASGATSRLPANGGLPPGQGIDLEYFVDEHGFSREMAAVSGPGVVWLDGLVKFPRRGGGEDLFARFVRLRGLGEPLEHGLLRFDDSSETFVPFSALPLEEERAPRGWSPFRHTDGGVEYLYFPQPFPDLRVPATLDALQDPEAYERFTPFAPGAEFDGANTRLAHDAEGEVDWAWRLATPAPTQEEWQRLVAAGRVRADASPFRFSDLETGARVVAHRGSVSWNDFRQRWIMIFCEEGGSSSYLGEIWYAEATAPEGPWHTARKIVTHDRYSFYNPCHHPFFDEDGGRVIYFEGTYTHTFSGTEVPTPRYDYNQLLYRLDLADERLRAAGEER